VNGEMDLLRERTIRGGAARLLGQLAALFLRIGSMMILARLLEPSDFGLVAMVIVVTTVFDIFSTGGLSAAAIQRVHIDVRQMSTLFWLNLAIGAVLASLCVVSAPMFSALYHEPRAALVVSAVAPAFLCTAAGVQHLALLQRELRYTALSVIEVAGQASAAAVSIGLALAQFQYWALIAGVIAAPLTVTVMAWLVTAWVPGLPRRDANISSMVRFGGTVTLNGLVVYVAYNIEKVLLGRYFGPDTLGQYGRACQLINLPTQALNRAVGAVAFASLSRLQDDPHRLKNYFIKGYTLVASVTLPTTLLCALFADDIVVIALGPKWTEAAAVFRSLAPMILVLGILDPTGWLMQAIGLQARSLNIGLVIAPLVVGSTLIGLPYGPTGVAIAQSTAMSLWLVPHIFWALHGTNITPRDLIEAAGRPLIASATAALALVMLLGVISMTPGLLRLTIGSLVMLSIYLCILLFVFKQKVFFSDVIRTLWLGA
jgi:O-antigen/teichoic acid export membrane protein